jgi:hypothetical protein
LARADALIYRTSADRALGRLGPPLADIDAALARAPSVGAGLSEPACRPLADCRARARIIRASQIVGGFEQSF